MRRPLVLLLALVPFLATPALAQGNLIIVGGGGRPDTIMGKFVELAGGPGARILVIPNASANAEGAGESQAEGLRRLGADASFVALDAASADDPAVLERFEGVTGVWFPGGVQSRLMDVIGGTRAADAIRQVYTRGGVVGGSSAGAAVMTTPMITGGEKRPAREDDDWNIIERNNVEWADGLDLLPDAVVDQHFVRRKRHNRLMSLAMEYPDKVGAGIDEATAIWVKADATWEVLGRSVVVIYDARPANVSPDRLPLGAANMRLHVLPHGGMFNPATGAAIMPGGSVPVKRF
ncbi:MAG: cyanophycinase [Gemmatimonadota bacterium]